MVCNDPSYDLTKHNPRQMSSGLPASGEYLGGRRSGGPAGLPLWLERTRVDQWTSCLHLCWFSTYRPAEAQGWTHFTLSISFLLCCCKLCNHLRASNWSSWLL